MNLVREGRYELEIGDRQFPPRYPPWFSLLVAAPTYLVAGTSEPGAPIYGVLLLALTGVIAVYWTGRQCGGTLGGVLAAGLLIVLPFYGFYAREILCDVPATATMLAAGALFLRVVRDGKHAHARLWLMAGIIVAVATGLRPACLSSGLPFGLLAFALFLRQSRQDGHVRAALRGLILRGLAVGSPPLLITSLTALYNFETFGSAFRSGYHFWCPVPYDYLHLTFSPDYVRGNIGLLLVTSLPYTVPIALVLLGLAWLVCKRHPDQRLQPVTAYLCFGMTSVIPLAGLHLFYFYSDLRLFLPFLVWIHLLCAVTLGCLLQRHVQRRTPALAIAALLLIWAAGSRWQEEPYVPIRRISADSLLGSTARGSLILSALDPVYLGLIWGPDHGREILPLSRSVEYASKLIAPSRIESPDPPPTGWYDHRCPGLIAGGAMEAVTHVAGESEALIAERIRNGVPVYLYSALLSQEDVDVIQKPLSHFRYQQVAAALYRMGVDPDGR